MRELDVQSPGKPTFYPVEVKNDLINLFNCISFYCDLKHPLEEKRTFCYPPVGQFINPIRVCSACRRLLAMGIGKRIACPRLPKPPCRKCPKPCYNAEDYDQLKQVMITWGIYKFKGKIKNLIPQGLAWFFNH